MSRSTVPSTWVPQVDRSSLPSGRVVLPGVVFVGVLLAWQFLVPAAGIAPYVLPTPTAILAALVTEWGTIVDAMSFSLRAFATSFVLTVVTGYLLALAMAEWRVLETTLYPYVVVARAIPVVTLLPIFILWLGFGLSSIVLVSYLIGFFPMVVNALAGFKSTDEELVEMLRSFSASRWQVFRNVYLYGSLPSVFAGIKIAVVLTFTGVIVGEFLVGSQGIGYLVLSYNTNLATPEMFAGVVVVSVTQLVLFGAVVAVERLVVDWR